MAKSSKKWKEDKILLLLGLCIGCVMSIKWIGCLTTLHVGLFIILDLFFKLISLDIPKFSVYFLKRAFYLISIPCSIYVGMFYLHFHIVNQSGPDDGFMSSDFQLSLKENLYKDLKKYVSYGNQVTIRGETGYIHSHFHTYPDFVLEAGEKQPQQMTTEEIKEMDSIPLQITTYSHSDSNNNFYFQKISDDVNDADFVNDNDAVALLHHETKGYLQQTLETSYMSDGFKVIGNREEGLDPLAVWIVEIESDSIKKEKRLKAVSSKFYLRNKETGMFLSTSTEKYPSWGFEQGEILCVKEKSKACLFNLQENFFSNADGNVLYTELGPSFIKKFLEHQKVMFKVNKSFVLDPDLAPEPIVSNPFDWFILKKGIRMSQWHDQFKFYMFMNPMIHYATSLGIILSPFILYFKFIRKARKANAKGHSSIKNTKSDYLSNENKLNSQIVGDQQVQFVQSNHKNRIIENKQVTAIQTNEHSEKLTKNDNEMTKVFETSKTLTNDAFFIFISFGGWVLHFIPFFIVGRVLYIHHYFPALFFATLNLCFLLRNKSLLTCTIFVGLCSLIFVVYSPLTYGFLDPTFLKKLKLFKTWNFVD